MRLYIFLLLFLQVVVPVDAINNSKLVEQLNIVLQNQSFRMQDKEKQINEIKNQLRQETEVQMQLKLCDKLYEAYYVYQFDSAMQYVDRGIKLARQSSDTYYYANNIIHKAELLAIGGLYSEAINTITELKITQLNRHLSFEYYLSLFRIYTYWAEFCHDDIYAPHYREIACENLKLAIPFLDNTDDNFEYYMGEYCVYVLNDAGKARRHYQKAVATLPEDSRFHAMACFALAGNYANAHNVDLYERYLVMACISDAKSLTMENFALQNLAMYTLENGRDNLAVENAQRYISISLENAKFYNNRLRIIEISDRLPIIVKSYQQQLGKRNAGLRKTLIAISLLAVFLIVAVTFIFKQNSRLGYSRRKLQESNYRLSEMNERQGSLNKQLHDLNEQLVKTNKKREGLVKLYIDLCSKYINRLKKQQTLVKRKIKANQAQELLTQLSSERLSEEDATTFLSRFDKAFLDLYPNFTQELNLLLTEKDRIIQVSSTAMTTEQRIMALIRLGVNESSEIANLLFYSPQTIYNYRSAIRAKAICKETFEADVAHLCTVIK